MFSPRKLVQRVLGALKTLQPEPAKWPMSSRRKSSSNLSMDGTLTAPYIQETSKTARPRLAANQVFNVVVDSIV